MTTDSPSSIAYSDPRRRTPNTRVLEYYQRVTWWKHSENRRLALENKTWTTQGGRDGSIDSRLFLFDYSLPVITSSRPYIMTPYSRLLNACWPLAGADSRQFA